jgi:hypothetical protein
VKQWAKSVVVSSPSTLRSEPPIAIAYGFEMSFAMTDDLHEDLGQLIACYQRNGRKQPEKAWKQQKRVTMF